MGTRRFLISTFAVYTVLFVFVFAGPFVGRKSTQTLDMTWTLDRTPSQGENETETIFTFVEHTDYGVGEFSAEMAAYLTMSQDPVVSVTFVVTRDYGRVRGFHMVKVAELTDWDSAYGCFYSSAKQGSAFPF